MPLRSTHRPHSSPWALAIALALACAAAAPVQAQELAIPAVDDAPSAQLLIEQASDQARANPREAVRLLLEALDGGAERLVHSGSDPSLFVTVGTRIHGMLLQDEALRTAFRREAQPPAAEWLSRGELVRLVQSRLDTEAGLEAALRMAQSAIARGRFASAAALLARCADSDLLVGRRALHHAAMRATALASLGDATGAAAARAVLERIAAEPAPAGAAAADTAWRAEAAPALAAAQAAAASLVDASADLAVGGEGRFDARAPRDWSETWNAPLQSPSSMPLLDFGQGRSAGTAASRPVRASAAPACDEEHVYLDDGNGLVAYDRLSGRQVWGHGPESANADPSQSTLNYLAVADDSVIAFTTQASPLARPGSGRVARYDAATGIMLWDARLDRLEGRTDLDGIVPQGTPLVVDGRAIVAARRTTARMETVTWLIALDLENPKPPAWMRVIATSGSARLRIARGADSPVLVGGVIYLASTTGAITAIDPGDGHIRWLRRSPVPVRDTANRYEPYETITPAVAGGRVLALSPDQARIEVLDAATGAEITAIPVSPEGPLGAPMYLLGDLPSGLVLAVGESIVCVSSAAPAMPLWKWPAAGTEAARAQGRVQFARRAGAPPVVVIPTERDVVVLDAGDGRELMRLPGAGDSNPLMAGNQLLTGGVRTLSSYMPVADAERVARERMATSASPDSALALLRLAKQVRRSSLAVEAAREALQRAGAAPEPMDVRLELLDLLLAVDAAEFATGADRDALDALVGDAATAAERPMRGVLARADRALRRKDPRAAARIAAEAALSAAVGTTVIAGGRSASIEAMAVARIHAARAADPRASEEVAGAIERALRDAPREQLAVVRRTAARLGAGSRAGTEALAALAAAASTPAERAAAARLVRECIALGAPAAPFEPFVSALSPALAADCAAPAPRAASITGTATRIVEFPGRLPRSMAGISAGAMPGGGLLTMQAEELVLRKGPGFAPAWRVPIGARDPLLLAVAPSVLLWDDAAPGAGSALSVTPEGTLRWRSATTADLFRDMGGDFATDGPTVDLGEGRSVAASQVLTLPAADALVLARRDGNMVGLSPEDGTSLWQRREALHSIAASARNAFAAAIAGEGSASDTGPVRVEAIEPRTGEAFLAWSPAEASEVRWLRLERSGLLVVATDAGIEARRTAGGDEDAPYWSVTVPDARGTLRGWGIGKWIVALDRYDGTMAIDARTGAIDPEAFRTPESTTLSPVRDLLEGDGWVAVLRDDRIDYFDLEGHFIGRDSPAADRGYLAAAAARGRLFVLDAGGQRSDLGGGRFPVLLHDFDPTAGGLATVPPMLLRTVGQRLSQIIAADGWVIVSNGSVMQAIDLRGPAPVLGTPHR